MWIVCNGERFRKYGEFKKPVASSEDAEAMAIINGLHIAKLVFKAERFHVVSDCKNAMSKVSNGDYRKHVREAVGNSRVTFAHVRAHTNCPQARSWVNRWCDHWAKEAMRAMRVKVRTSQAGA